MTEKTAPVQGWPGGIPWSLHLEAYAAYNKRYRPQPALIEGDCRGGFSVGELDGFIPGWRDKASEIASLRAELDALRKERDSLRVAMQGLMQGCEYVTLQGIATWHTKAIPTNKALDAARAAMAKVAP